MSFDLYLDCFKSGVATHFSASLAHDAFGNYVTHQEPDFLQVTYSDSQGSDIHLSLTESNSLFGLSVNRPCGDIRLYEALLKILTSAPVVLYFPGGPPLVAQSAMQTHIPADMREVLGEPIVIKSAEEILLWIARV